MERLYSPAGETVLKLNLLLDTLSDAIVKLSNDPDADSIVYFHEMESYDAVCEDITTKLHLINDAVQEITSSHLNAKYTANIPSSKQPSGQDSCDAVRHCTIDTRKAYDEQCCHFSWRVSPFDKLDNPAQWISATCCMLEEEFGDCHTVRCVISDVSGTVVATHAFKFEFFKTYLLDYPQKTGGYVDWRFPRCPVCADFHGMRNLEDLAKTYVDSRIPIDWSLLENSECRGKLAELD